jgi:hypothetical protein
MTEQEQPETEPGAEIRQDVAVAKEATVRSVGGWRLIEYGTWEVSVGPDGLLMLPRHLHPREVDDFLGAMLAAKEVAEGVVAENAKNFREVDLENLPSEAAIVTEGPPPPGAARAIVTAREQAASAPRSTIGRPKWRDPRLPPGQQSTRQLPIPGGRNGRRQ